MLIRRNSRIATLLTFSFLLSMILLVPTLSVASPDKYTGQWFLEKSDKPDQLHATLRYERRSSGNHWNYMSSYDMPASQAVGLPTEAFTSSGMHGQFRLERAAGTFVCDGWFANGKGSGNYTFTPNAQFISELQRRGVGQPTEEQQFRLALSNVSLELVDTLKQAGYTFNVDELVRTADHGVSLDYIRQINALGYRPSSLQGLVRMRDHGVTPEYVRAIQSAGLKNLSEDEITRMRDHGVTIEFINGLAQFGIRDLPSDALIRLRDHGVTPDYISGLRKVGITATPEEMTHLRDHGVSVEFVSSVRNAGFANVSPRELSRLRDHGVSVDYMKKHGKGRSIDEIIRMHDRGLDEDTL